MRKNRQIGGDFYDYLTHFPKNVSQRPQKVPFWAAAGHKKNSRPLGRLFVYPMTDLG